MDLMKRQAYSNLGIPESNRVILSIDGGGMRGIFTLQLLKKMEEVRQEHLVINGVTW
jgi:patatin-like phospholipase/acyl hydrolase